MAFGFNPVDSIGDAVDDAKDGVDDTVDDVTGFTVDDLETQVENINGNPQMKNALKQIVEYLKREGGF